MKELCIKNTALLTVIDERTNHLTDEQKTIKESIKTIKDNQEEMKEDMEYLKQKANKRFFGLSKKEIATILLSIPTLVTLLQVLFKQFGWL